MPCDDWIAYWTYFIFNCLEPDSAEIVVDVDDSNEASSKEDLADAVVTEDDNSDEVNSDVNDNADDDSQEGICDGDNSLLKRFFIEFDTQNEKRKFNRDLSQFKYERSLRCTQYAEQICCVYFHWIGIMCLNRGLDVLHIMCSVGKNVRFSQNSFVACESKIEYY